MSGIGKHCNRFGVLLGAVVFVLAGAQVAPAQTGLLGDVNLDGLVNILDIQCTINQALGVASETAEADLDENVSVDILDVQNLINTVLGVGGLVQRVSAVIDCDSGAEQTIIAVSNEGLYAEGVVDPQTQQVEQLLRVKTGWALALFVDAGEGQPEFVGAVEFPVADLTSITLPLPSLSVGYDLPLGVLSFNSPAVVGQDIRELLQSIVPPIDPSDNNGNGIPDFIEPLLEQVLDAPGVPPGADIEPLLEAIRDCVAAFLDELTEPNLADEDENGIPDFIEPLIECLVNALQDWLEGMGVPVPPIDTNGNGIPDAIEAIVAYVTDGISDWLPTVGRPELVDENENGIPDFIEHLLSVPGIPSFVDGDGNGIPDFAEDYAGDGIPNIFGPKGHIPGDFDGDGVPDEYDVDADNDGIPDYAQ